VIDTVRGLVGLKPRSYLLGVPRREETEGLLLLGDPGTGKSQIIHQLLCQIGRREPGEAVVCYDPACEFVEAHFDPKTDLILNPLDARSPYWAPTLEVDYSSAAMSATDRQMLAESFFPDREHAQAHGHFFTKAARSIFARMLEFKPTAGQIVEWLCGDEVIDQLVEGTEYAHLIDKGSKGQRGGVLGTLSEVGEAMRLLPAREECAGTLSLTRWAQARRGWLFITSTQDTRDALRALHAPWINVLLKRLMSVPREFGQWHPCWVIVDEVHSLRRLPALQTTLVEGRKYGVKMVLGTQNKAQFEEHNGRGAATMLSAPHTKILFRCNEPESARWVADMIGEEEKERPRVGTTATVDANGRDSINYSTFTERRAVVSKEEVMALPNLHGFWKYADSVVPFRIEPQNLRRVADGFIRRAGQPAEQSIQPPRPPRELAAPTPPQPAPAAPPRAEQPSPALASSSGQAARREVKEAERARSVTVEVQDEIDLSF
jgi:hypothetical protein